jgi:hypothetical protein
MDVEIEVRDSRFEGRNRDNIFNGQIQFEITPNGGAVMSQINYSAMSYRDQALFSRRWATIDRATVATNWVGSIGLAKCF